MKQTKDTIYSNSGKYPCMKKNVYISNENIVISPHSLHSGSLI